MTGISREDDLIGYARKVATCVYIAVEKDVAKDISDTILALLARLSEVEKALEPFAAEASRFEHIGDELYRYKPDRYSRLSTGDFVRALSALTPKGE